MIRSSVLPLLAWLLLLATAFVTLAPIGLRPESGLPPSVERFAAFLLLSFVFTLAYPHRLLRVILIVAAAAIGLEALQLLIPTRDARLIDMAMKLLGGGVGAGLGVAMLRLFPPESA
jgi:hypothetical protein